MKGYLFGYVRVSSKTQNEARQIETMRKLGVEEQNIFVDKSSGKDTDRKEYQRLKQICRKGDTIIFDSITRLSRSYNDIKNEYAVLTEKGVLLNFVNEPMLNTKDTEDILQKAMSDIILTLLSAFAEKERIDIKVRQAEGIALAKKNGVQLGRPSIELPLNWNEEYTKWKNKKQTAVQFMQNINMTKTTLYRKIREYENLSEK